MHPLKKDTEASHASKLRAMTEDYGDANSTMKQLASVNKYKQEGPEEHVGYGADADRPNLHAARRIRKPAGGNAIATYKRGGAVKHRDSGGAIGPGGGAPSKQGLGTTTYPGAVKDSQKDPTVSSESSPTPVDNRAFGGRTGGKAKGKGKGKGDTHVNIMVGQHGAPGAAGMPPVSAMPTPPMPPPGARPPMPPMAGPPPGGLPPGAAGPPGGPGAGLLPPGAAPPGAVPPGLVARPPLMPPPRKHGGRVMKHDDAREDAAMIKHMVKQSAMKPHGSMRAAGGRMTHLTAGAYSGEGRLEKAHQNKRIAPQKV